MCVAIATEVATVHLTQATLFTSLTCSSFYDTENVAHATLCPQWRATTKYGQLGVIQMASACLLLSVSVSEYTQRKQ